MTNGNPVSSLISRFIYYAVNVLPRSQNPQAFSCQQICKRHSRREPADVSHIGDSASLRGLCNRAETVNQLEYDPQANYDQRRHIHSSSTHQHTDMSLWE